MNILKKLTACCICISLAGFHQVELMAENYTAYVNPMIGTGDHGHVFVGANVPFGLVNAGPTQVNTGWDWCSGYHFSGDTIIGFAQMHLSGTGCSDLGDIALMPVVGPVGLTRKEMGSTYSHDRETVRPGYYSVHLERFGIRAELTATQRVAFHKYTFPATDDARILVDLQNGVGDIPVDCHLIKLNDRTIAGYRISRGWTSRQQIYFVAEFSKPFKQWIVSAGNEVKNGTSIASPKAYGQAVFDAVDNEVITVKVALSPVSETNAMMNLQKELPGWDFDAVCRLANDCWNRELGRIKATFTTEKQRTIFYTSLYHLMVAPSVYNDVNGDYRGSDHKVYRAADFTNYTTLSLWDTYRAAQPLATLIFPEMMRDMAVSFLKIYEQQGKLPVWHLMNNETNCMVGCPAVPVMADICLKGFDVDKEKAFEAIKNSLLMDERGLKYLREQGYLPYDKGENESVAKNMEYFLADWSAAQLARQLGKTQDYEYFLNRSRNYKKLFDSRVNCMRALSSDGQFRSLEGFNPGHQTVDYTEGNPWQYTWLVPHDVNGLINLFGSEKRFTARLDSLFLADSDLGEHANPDISGLIGQYAHGNEPSHHVIYLYNYVGQPWKAARRLRQVMETLYHDQPAGLCGNEDVGQMSAWYLMSALGFYPVKPCGGEYVLGSPLVKEASIKVGKDKTFQIKVHHNSDKNIYIQRVKFNGKEYKQSYIQHQDMVKGGTLEFFMGSKPSAFGTAKNARPRS